MIRRSPTPAKPAKPAARHGTRTHRSGRYTPRYGPLGRRVAINALEIGLALSLGAHLLLAATGFTVPQLTIKRQQDRGLEVVLVNAKHARRPADPQVLAQANLDGGGNTAQKVRTTSPLPVEQRERDGDALLETQRQVQELEARQRELLARAQGDTSAITADPQPDNQPQPEPQSDLGADVLERSRALLRQEAIIDRQLREYAQRPRKQFVGARAQEYRFARYVEDWRQKVENVGTLNYPASARGRLTGSLLLSVEIRADGSVASAEITRSSGHKVLDEAALRIIQLSAPFSAFPPDIRRDTDVLVITRTWTFTRSDEVIAR